jgi:hypothetical protein
MEAQLWMKHTTARPANQDELKRMRSHVIWIYERGQPVALWEETGFITLVPASLPSRGVVILQKPTQSSATGAQAT